VTPLLVLEACSRLLITASPAVAAFSERTNDYKIGDEALGLRGNPRFPDHDAAGWRNATRPDDATVVAIGDSQTYGSETSRADAWPQLAEKQSGIPFYQLAIGGYGPVSYWKLVDEALPLAPDWILVAFYDGNDFYDAFRDVYLQERAPEWQDPQQHDALMQLQETGPALHDAWQQTRVSRKAPGKARLLDWMRWLEKRLAIYRLVRGAMVTGVGRPDPPESRVRDDFASYKARAGRAAPGLLEIYEDGERSTIFTPRGRLEPMNLDDPRVRESVRLVLELIDDIQRKCRGRTRLGFVMIPTKELVWAKRVRETGAELHESFEALVEAETGLRERVTTHLEELGIPWVDALPEMRASLAAGRPPYGMNWNGHPNPEGNAAIARAALALLQAHEDRPVPEAPPEPRRKAGPG
jgi:hypothetical protein